MSEKKKSIPTPSNDVVRSYLKEWESLEDYREQENAIDNLFHEVYKGNSDLNGILIKCSVLNDFYSTNIFKVFPVAKHIQSINNIDDRLSSHEVYCCLPSLRRKEHELLQFVPDPSFHP